MAYSLPQASECKQGECLRGGDSKAELEERVKTLKAALQDQKLHQGEWDAASEQLKSQRTEYETRMCAALACVNNELENAQYANTVLLNLTIWRAMGAVRCAANLLPLHLRRGIRAILRTIYRVFTKPIKNQKIFSSEL